jgi:hypothetical protein
VYSTKGKIICKNKCDLIAYDYGGYGKSAGKPSEKEIYSDIEEVAFFTSSILGINPKDIILLGQSLGSAPTVHLSITKEFRDVRGMILLSPIASGVRLVSPDMHIQDLEKIDVFCNIKKIVDVSCPIFLIHGKKDMVIPVQESVEMSKYMKHPYAWQPRNGDHNNILTLYRHKFFIKCKSFMCILKNNKSKNSIVDTNCSEFTIRREEKHLKNLKNMYYCNKDSIVEEINGRPSDSEQIILRDNCIYTITEKTSHVKKVEKSNNHNIDRLEFPFEIISDCPEDAQENSQDIERIRLSSDSNIISMVDQKKLEHQYNKMFVKYNGI